jgi:tetratricopeptide (TPR) repeat protein
MKPRGLSIAPARFLSLLRFWPTVVMMAAGDLCMGEASGLPACRSGWLFLACCALALGVAGGHPVVWASSDSALPDPTLIERYQEYDRLAVAEGDVERARKMAQGFFERLVPCRDYGREARALEECALRAILGDGSLKGLPRSMVPAESTVTSVLADGCGSCAALAATVLALTESLGEPFHAWVLRDHVLLVSTTSPSVYYELLEGGRRVASDDLSEYGPLPPGRPTRVRGDDFLPYYLDNLAARYADRGEDEIAGRLFLEALELAPGSARIHYNYGTFLLRLDQNEAARIHLDRAIRRGWKDAAAYVNRGAALWRLGRVKAARRDFTRALKLDPTHEEARTNVRLLETATKWESAQAGPE